MVDAGGFFVFACFVLFVCFGGLRVFLLLLLLFVCFLKIIFNPRLKVAREEKGI